MNQGTFARPGKALFIALLLFFAPGPTQAEDAGTYDGMIIPKDFIPLCAPQNTLRLPFWGSDSNSIQLMSVEPEGKKVKKGDPVAVFYFTSDEAKDYLNQQLARLKAQREERQIALEKTIQDFQERLDKAKIQARIAEIELAKATTLSKIRQATLEFQAKQQEFETRALTHKLKAAKENLASVGEITKNQIAVWQSYFGIFDTTKKRFTVLAPDDGALFYPHIEKKKRKIKAGDDMNSGLHFLSLVKSDRTELQFYLPEKDFSRIKPGDTVLIILDGREIPARVFGVSFFPQRFGDVRDDYHLANAWEKCFVVRADVLEKLQVGSNSNVRVKPKP